MQTRVLRQYMPIYGPYTGMYKFLERVLMIELSTPSLAIMSSWYTHIANVILKVNFANVIIAF